ncbi:helix-turn-helix transcriptional regulator [Stenotrophomonas bentonitica]|uniref:helix-turn-helix transcriptional regulator n=1 Tax=Stenotrophomonas bentonitica TaxID=1450134 RepID=UPI00345F0E90
MDIFNMAKRTPPVRPQHARRIEALGQRLRTARMARGMTQANLAERVGVDRTTIGKLEAGDPSTSLSTVLRVLSTLGLEQDIDRIAAADEVGAQLAAGNLRRPSPQRSKPSRRVAGTQADQVDEMRTPATTRVAEPEAERYALRASHRPPPIPLPPGASARPKRGS